MDKQEYREIVSDIRNAYDRQEYDKVLMYANELELRKVSDSRVLEMVADSYASIGELESAMELLEKAYEKTPMGRKLAYKLSELSIETGDLDGAVRYYEDFRKMAPHDNSWILLKYKIGKAGGVAKKDLVKALAAYCSKEVDEQWMAELAELYDELGDKDKCNEVCDDIILWFADGIYVQRALELKERNSGLTEAQLAKLKKMKEEAAAPAVSLEESADYSGEREFRPGSMEDPDSDDLDSILEEFITIEDATAPPQRMQTSDLTEAMSGMDDEITGQPKRMETSDLTDAMSELDSEIQFQENPQPDTEVIPVEQIRQVEMDSAEAEEDILNAIEDAAKAAELEDAIVEVVEDVASPENEPPLPSAESIIMEEMELKTAPVHEEVQEAIAGNMDHPEPEVVPDILSVPEPEEQPAVSEEAAPAEEPSRGEKQLFTAAESNGKPFSNIEALQIARTAPPKDDASFWKMPEELSVGEEPVREEFTEPVYGSHRWFEQPQEPDPDFEEPIFGAHRFVPQPEIEEDEISDTVTIEQVAPEPIVIEQAEEEDYFQPHVSTIRTTSSVAELAGLYASAKYAEQDAQLSDQAALVRKPSLGIKKVLPPEMFADPITEPEYYEGPVYFSDEESGAKQPEPEEASEPEPAEKSAAEAEGPVLADIFGKTEIDPAQQQAIKDLVHQESIKTETAAAPVTEEPAKPEPLEMTPSDDFEKSVSGLELVQTGETDDSEFENAVREFEKEQNAEGDAMAAETEFIPAAMVSDLIKKDIENEEEIAEAGSQVLDEIFAEGFTDDDFEEKILEFDREQQKEAQEKDDLAKTIQDLKERILELEQAQKGGISKPGKESSEEEETAAENLASEETAAEETFSLDGKLIEAILAEEAEEEIPQEETVPEEALEQDFGKTASVARIFEEDTVLEDPSEEEPSGLTQVIRFIDTENPEAEEESPEETEPKEPEIPEETYDEILPERPSPFMFSVMPHESIEEVVPDILLERQNPEETVLPEETKEEPEAEPSIFVPSEKTETEPESGKAVVPVSEEDFEEPFAPSSSEEPAFAAEEIPSEHVEEMIDIVPESAVEEPPFEEDQKEEEIPVLEEDQEEEEIPVFEEEQNEEEVSEFERVVQDFELSNRAEEYWEEEVIEEPQVDEAPIEEITAPIPPVEEPSGLTQVIRFIDTEELEEPQEEGDSEPAEVEAVSEPMEETVPQEELSDFERAMLAFEASSRQVPEEEFTPDELDAAIDDFLDESIEPWEEPEFGMPEFEESEFEKPEYLGNDFDEPEHPVHEFGEPDLLRNDFYDMKKYVPEEPYVEEEPVLPAEAFAEEEPEPEAAEEELQVERELSDFEKALLAFDGEQAKAELDELLFGKPEEKVFPEETFKGPEAAAAEPAVIPEERFEEPFGVSEGYQIPDDMREELSEFLLINGMEGRICNAIGNIVQIKRSGDPTGGNLIITGDAKSGKTYLTISLIKAVGKEIGSSTGRVAKVQAEALNGKDMNKAFGKIKGSDLIIENAGYLSDETVERLMAAMKTSNTSSMVVLEGNELGIENILVKYPQLTELFRTRLDLAELSLAEWADLAVEYANEQGYEVGDMALLALHAKIDEMNLPTTRLVVEDIHGIIDDAIEKANRRSYGRLRSRKKGRENVFELDETDFM